MPGYSTYLKNAWLNVLRGVALDIDTVYVSGHSADPGDTGANELSGGGYARVAITFAAAAAGAMTSSNQPVFDVEGGDTVAFIGFWDDPVAGNYLGSADVTNEVFGADGTYTLTDADLDLNA